MGPPSRRNRTQKTAREIDDIKASAEDGVAASFGGKSRMLTDVCDVDEKMGNVLHWSKEEAKKFTAIVRDLTGQKQNPKHAKNEELFIKNFVMKPFQIECEEERKLMEEAERHKRYAIQVHEQMAIRDQETLSKYVILLESKLRKRMVEQTALSWEVHHLRVESQYMRYTKEEIKRNEQGADAPGGAEGETEAIEEVEEEPEDEQMSEHSAGEKDRASAVYAAAAPKPAPRKSKDPNATVVTVNMQKKESNVKFAAELIKFSEDGGGAKQQAGWFG